MTRFLFPDTTVLRNFAHVGQLDLLGRMLDGRGRWTDTVASEVTEAIPYCGGLREVEEQGWLGEPIEVDDPEEVYRIERLRRAAFGGRPEKPRKHLGEAQTCYVIQNWPEFAQSWWISDDRASLRYARQQGLCAYDTTGLMDAAVSDRVIDLDAGHQVPHAMHAAGRPVPPPSSGGAAG